MLKMNFLFLHLQIAEANELPAQVLYFKTPAPSLGGHN